jgi:hypothetical protein
MPKNFQGYNHRQLISFYMTDEWKKEGELTGTNRHILVIVWWVLMGFLDFRWRMNEAVCA